MLEEESNLVKLNAINVENAHLAQLLYQMNAQLAHQDNLQSTVDANAQLINT
jgi:hypothetical protein